MSAYPYLKRDAQGEIADPVEWVWDQDKAHVRTVERRADQRERGVRVAEPFPFRDWLRQQMIDRKLNVRTTAKLIGISHSAVEGWVYERHRPNRENCERIAAAFAVDVETVKQLAGLHERMPRAGEVTG